jgi:hypothetical protein
MRSPIASPTGESGQSGTDEPHANRADERLVATPLVGNVVDDVSVEGETEFLLT